MNEQAMVPIGRNMHRAAAAALAVLTLAASAQERVRYKVNTDRSSAGFTLQATMHTVEGTGGRVSGEFERASVADGDSYAMSGEMIIQATTLETGNSARDRKMRRDVLSVEKYPTIRFRPRRAVLSAAGSIDTGSAKPSPAKPFPMVLEGDLTVRERTRPISIPVIVTLDGQHLIADGKTRLSFLDYGVPDPSNFFLRVKPEMEVSFHLDATAL